MGTQCYKDDWVSGMWFFIAGVSITVAGLLSLLVIGPVLDKR